MSGNKQIRDAIKLIAGNNGATNILCTVDSVNLVRKTCYCIPVNGDADFGDVKLIVNPNNGFLIVPTVGSYVYISVVSPGVAFVSMFSEVQEIQLAGDIHGGLVKIQQLITQLNTLQTEINTLKTATGTAIAVYSSAIDGGASSGVFNAVVLPQIVTNTLENTSVKHGNG